LRNHFTDLNDQADVHPEKNFPGPYFPGPFLRPSLSLAESRGSITGNPGVTAITVGGIARVLTLAEVGCAIFFSNECFRGKSLSLVRAIAKGLTGGISAGAEEIGFAGLEFDGDGMFGGNGGLIHRDYSSVQ